MQIFWREFKAGLREMIGPVVIIFAVVAILMYLMGHPANAQQRPPSDASVECETVEYLAGQMLEPPFPTKMYEYLINGEAEAFLSRAARDFTHVDFSFTPEHVSVAAWGAPDAGRIIVAVFDDGCFREFYVAERGWFDRALAELRRGI